MEPSKESEFTLSFKNQSAVVSPYGASLRQYSLKDRSGEWNVIWGYSGTSNKKGGQGDVLVPFPGRIKDGTYEFSGVRHQLAKNDKEGPNAIHGFLRTELYSVVEQTSTRAVFNYKIMSADFASRGYPFSVSTTISYTLSDSGLTTSFAIENIDDSPAPVGIGFHPYFRAMSGDLSTWSVQIPARNYIEFKSLVPTGAQPSTSGTNLDFQTSRVIGNTEYNACLAHLNRDREGYARASLTDAENKSRITLTLDSTFDYIVIYTGDQIPAPHTRPGFAIEPMTCAPDAFNRSGWGSRELQSGDVFKGSYSIFAEIL